jgi:hypothetical protein
MKRSRILKKVIFSQIAAETSKSAQISQLHFLFPQFLYTVRQKYLTILQNCCVWNRWRGKFVFERSSSETQNISVTMERWSVQHRAFVVETYLKTIILS